MSIQTAIQNLPHLDEVEQNRPQLVEKRQSPRRRLYETHWMTMSSVTKGFSSFLVARLIDLSPGGLGVYTLEPVEVGHEYAVAGEVQVDGRWLEMWGHAHVVHCRPSKEDMYRVGLKATGIHWRDIPQPS